MSSRPVEIQGFGNSDWGPPFFPPQAKWVTSFPVRRAPRTTATGMDTQARKGFPRPLCPSRLLWILVLGYHIAVVNLFQPFGEILSHCFEEDDTEAVCPTYFFFFFSLSLFSFFFLPLPTCFSRLCRPRTQRALSSPPIQCTTRSSGTSRMSRRRLGRNSTSIMLRGYPSQLTSGLLVNRKPQAHAPVDFYIPVATLRLHID